MYLSNQVDALSRVTLSAPLSLADREILTPEAIEFISSLATAFEDRRRKIIARRAVVQHEINLGMLPGFPESTGEIRRAVWRVRPAPADLADRRVEVCISAADRRMLLLGMNSWANLCVADFGDSQSPTWANVMESQRNVKETLSWDPASISVPRQSLRRSERSPALSVCPRGWHMTECHFHLDGEPVSASLFDFGLFIFHNGRRLADRGESISVHIPKIENRFEAALWEEVLCFAEDRLKLQPGSVRTTILLDTLTAAFEIEEILYELRGRATAVSYGRRNYIFSVIKKLHNFSWYSLPERDHSGPEPDFMEACLLLLVQKAHRRGARVLSGMLWEPDVSGSGHPTDDLLDRFMERVTRDIKLGTDGVTVMQPSLAGIARESLSSFLRSADQIHIVHPDVTIAQSALLDISPGSVSESGVRENIQATVRYIGAWLAGTGTISYLRLLEDTAAAEIGRAQIWHWLQHSKRLTDGNILDQHLFRKIFNEETEKIREDLGPERYRLGQYDLASRVLFNMAHQQEFQQFLTTKTYQYL